ncbi:MAG TPA: dihydroneopterin aldolase [Vicinamibacteria bacterium]
MSLRIRLADLRFDGCHGASAAERSLPRRFEVDVEMEAAVEAAARSDSLADTIDYAEVAGVIVAIGTGPALHLLEALARRMVDGLVEKWPGARISLEVRKLSPPNCPGSPAFAAVRVVHSPGASI